MTYFLRNGNTYRLSDEASLDLHHTLPVGNYIIKQDQFGNLYLEQVDSFEFKGKRYGDNIRNTERIIDTFLNRTASTGVMLTGEKGSGKSLLAKTSCIAAADKGIPTIIINRAWFGDAFNAFIQSIDQPAVVLFDEFEKVYAPDEQEQLLTLLDGVFPSKKLFILTCNDKYRVDYHLRNRPGRVFYMLDFNGVDVEFIREYCADNLKANEHTETICKVSALFDQFNFDMLKSLVEEMNRYNETPQEALRMLNVKPEFSNSQGYEITLTSGGLDVNKKDIDDNGEWSGSPLAREVRICYFHRGANGDARPQELQPVKCSGLGILSDDCDDDGDESGWRTLTFTQSDLVQVDANGGKFVFANGTNRLVLTKKQANYQRNYYDLLS